MALYLSWLHQVSPGAVPNFFGLFAWSAARLFVEQAVALGGKLDPAGAGRRRCKGVKTGPATACTCPQHVGGKHDRELRAVPPAQRRQVEPVGRATATSAATAPAG